MWMQTGQRHTCTGHSWPDGDIESRGMNHGRSQPIRQMRTIRDFWQLFKIKNTTVFPPLACLINSELWQIASGYLGNVFMDPHQATKETTNMKKNLLQLRWSFHNWSHLMRSQHTPCFSRICHPNSMKALWTGCCRKCDGFCNHIVIQVLLFCTFHWRSDLFEGWQFMFHELSKRPCLFWRSLGNAWPSWTFARCWVLIHD